MFSRTAAVLVVRHSVRNRPQQPNRKQLTFDSILADEHPQRWFIDAVNTLVEQSTDLQFVRKSYLVKLHIYARLGNWKRCKEMLSLMKKYRIRSTPCVLNSVLLAMMKSGEDRKVIDDFLDNYNKGNIENVFPDSSGIIAIVACSADVPSAAARFRYFTQRYNLHVDKNKLRRAFIKVNVRSPSLESLNKIEASNPINERDLIDMIEAYSKLGMFPAALRVHNRLWHLNRKEPVLRDINILLDILHNLHKSGTPFSEVFEKCRAHVGHFDVCSFIKLVTIASESNELRWVEEVHRLARLHRKDNVEVQVLANTFYTKARREKVAGQRHPFFDVPLGT
eukprot:TRINITY_DN24508_c0_g1_i1.p1 TRINITY_DN24508_c0_g1~~TRINITY_DN24508_c0_g1_i1.p1  ORF type:complete len:337 (+),score=37.41 TRINITY_DN24508_c0_g1_i1:102-1112(+)